MLFKEIEKMQPDIRFAALFVVKDQRRYTFCKTQVMVYRKLKLRRD